MEKVDMDGYGNSGFFIDSMGNKICLAAPKQQNFYHEFLKNPI